MGYAAPQPDTWGHQPLSDSLGHKPPPPAKKPGWWQLLQAGVAHVLRKLYSGLNTAQQALREAPGNVRTRVAEAAAIAPQLTKPSWQECLKSARELALYTALLLVIVWGVNTSLLNLAKAAGFIPS